jgi:hypothetical protein
MPPSPSLLSSVLSPPSKSSVATAHVRVLVLSSHPNVTTPWPPPPPPRQLRHPSPWIQSPSLGSSIGGPINASTVTISRRALAAGSLTCWAPSRRFSPPHAGAKCGRSSPPSGSFAAKARCLRRQSSCPKSHLSDPAPTPARACFLVLWYSADPFIVWRTWHETRCQSLFTRTCFLHLFHTISELIATRCTKTAYVQDLFSHV